MWSKRKDHFFSPQRCLTQIWDLLTYMRASSKTPDGYTPAFFITGTARRRMGKDELEVVVRKYILWLSRRTKHHLVVRAGIEWGENTHFHLVVYIKGELNDAQKLIFTTWAVDRRLWGYGIVDCRDWDPDQFADVYTMNHYNIPFGNEVFCPAQKSACRKGRCPEQINMRF